MPHTLAYAPLHTRPTTPSTHHHPPPHSPTHFHPHPHLHTSRTCAPRFGRSWRPPPTAGPPLPPPSATCCAGRTAGRPGSRARAWRPRWSVPRRSRPPPPQQLTLVSFRASGWSWGCVCARVCSHLCVADAPVCSGPAGWGEGQPNAPTSSAACAFPPPAPRLLGPIDAAAAPAPKRRKVGPEAVFGVRVGTEQLDRLWNTTEDNTSGAMRCGACSGMCRVWGLTVSPAVVLSGGCLDWSALLTHLLPVSPDYHPSAPPHPPCPARPLLPASQR